MRLRYKLIFYFLFLAIVPMALISFLIISNASQEIRNQTSAQMKVLNKVRKNDFDNMLQSCSERTLFLASVIGKSSVESNELIQKLFVAFIQNNPNTYKTSILNPNGAELIAVTSKNRQINIVAKDDLEDKSHYPYFQQALKKKPHEVYVSDLELNEDNGQVEIPHRPVLHFSVPVFNATDNLSVVLTIDVDMTNDLDLKKMVKGETLLIDQDGQFLIHPQKEKTFGKQLHSQFNYITEQPELQKNLKESDSLEYEDKEDHEYRIWQKIFIDPADSSRFWVIIRRISDAQLLEETQKLKNNSVILMGLFGVFSLILALITAKSIAEPIQKITEVTQRIAGGELGAKLSDVDVDVDVENRDEVMVLSRAINSMSASLSESTKQLAGIVKALDQFAIVAETDLKGKITFANDKFCQITKYAREEIIGKDHRDLINSKYHSKEFWNDFWSTIQQGQVWRGYICNKAKDGEIYWVDTTIVPMLDANGKAEKYLAVRVLITERKLAEEATHQANLRLEKTNKELDEFSYIVSHDLKAPLRGVGSVTDWLIQDYHDKLDDEGKEHLRSLRNRVTRMSGLIDGVLRYSKISKEKAEKEIIDTQALVTDCIELLDAPKHIQISIDHKLPQIKGVRVQMEQVFQNLLSNAIRYIESDKGEIHIDYQDDGLNWHFTVADNGPGIAEEYFEKIFKIFQTLSSRDKVESTGIGLTIVKKIIELHGGKIWPTSKVGQGTTIHFLIPKEVS